MAEQDTTPTTEGTTPQTQSADGSGNATEAFEPITSQEEFNERIKARIKRVKATPPADYEELKAKAARLDELEAAQKSDLEKANDAATKARAKADEWKAKFEQLQAEQERQQTVAQMAAQYKVDAGTLARMSGDVEDNAKYLAGLEAARPKHGDLPDSGERGKPSMTRAEILAVKDTQERQRLIAENIGLFS